MQKRITQTIINQDLNTLLSPKKYQEIRTILKQETIQFISDEIKRITP